MGLAQYTLRQYDEAEATFETARSLDPYRLAHMDTYSNILYVKEKRAELSRLAHAVVEVHTYNIIMINTKQLHVDYLLNSCLTGIHCVCPIFILLSCRWTNFARRVAV